MSTPAPHDDGAHATGRQHCHGQLRPVLALQGRHGPATERFVLNDTSGALPPCAQECDGRSCSRGRRAPAWPSGGIGREYVDLPVQGCQPDRRRHGPPVTPVRGEREVSRVAKGLRSTSPTVSPTSLPSCRDRMLQPKGIIATSHPPPRGTPSIHTASSEHLASGCRSRAGLFD